MPARKSSSDKKVTWSKIGSMVGMKADEMEKLGYCAPPYNSWVWHHHQGSGMAGRFLFICGVFLAMSEMAILPGLPWFVIALIIIGFTMMRF